MTDPELETAIEQSHRGWDAFTKGDPEPAKALFSRRADVSYGNPFGPFVRGWEQTAEVMDRAAAMFSGGGSDTVTFERLATYASGDIACIVEVERYQFNTGGDDDDASGGLRVTTVLRREGGVWKLVHRHADPSPRPAESVTPS